ncbi:MAG: hypothetical protein WCZ00_06505 [Acholeplasmataceae bacterium]
MKENKFYTKRYYRIAKIGAIIILIFNIINLILLFVYKSDISVIIGSVLVVSQILFSALIDLLKEPFLLIKEEKLFARFYLWYEGFEFDQKDIMTIDSIPIDRIDYIEFFHVRTKKYDKKKKMMKIKMVDDLIVSIEIDTLKEDDVTKLKDVLRKAYV